MMIHSHRADDPSSTSSPPNVIARLMGIDADAKPQFRPQRRRTNKCGLQLPYYTYRGVTDDDRSFRSEYLTTKHTDDAAPASPRLLFRSFSAPESGFSFSFKQREASEPPGAAVRMRSKSVVSAGFSFIRGTVSSLTHSFISRRDLPFRKKTHWSNKASIADIHPAKMEMPICAATSPSHETFSLFKVAQANLSELPPSPVSPLEVAGGHSCRHFFTDLQFTLPPEPSPKCLSDQFEAPATTSESSFRTDITTVETACSRDKACITELLIAAGLYDDDDDGPSSGNARVDSMARPMPICDDVFEDIEDMYYYRGDYIGGGGMYDDGGAREVVHHRCFDGSSTARECQCGEGRNSWMMCGTRCKL